MSDVGNMSGGDGFRSAAMSGGQRDGIRFLVESALRSVASTNGETQPRTREGWIDQLCAALVSDSETSHKAVISSLIATGVSQQEIMQSFIPEVSRALGEMWVQDRASFVDVTLGAARLQALYREYDDEANGHWIDRTIPLGQSVLMVIPEFEQHSLGAFVAADRLRRYGLWVHMGLSLSREELIKVVAQGRFSMVGMSLSTMKSVEKATELIDYIRLQTPDCPPIVIGGSVVDDPRMIERRTGADHAVTSVREAVERCGMAAIRQELPLDSLL